MADEDRPNGNYLRGFKQRVAQLLVGRHRSDYELGRMIEECREGRYWRWWSWEDADGNDRVGYPSFTDWCWASLGFKRRKADMLRENFNNHSPMNLDENGPTFSRAMRVGWSKLHQILRVARNEDTLIAWLDVVETDNLSFEELKAKVRWALAEAAENTSGSGGSVDGGDPDSNDDPAPPTRVHWPVVFESRESLDVVLQAHKLIQSRYDQEIGLGKALAMVATHYLATSTRDEEGGAAVDAEYMIRAFEENFRLAVAPTQAPPAPQPQPVASAAGPRRRRRPPMMTDL